MNINQVSRSLEIYQNSVPVKSVNKTNSKLAGRGNDTITLSDTAKDFKTAMEALRNVPDTRAEKIQRLKEEISSNNYNINASEISERILSANFDAIG